MENARETFQILALDGGGIKGLFSAAFLAAIEEDLGISIADHFDLITGTSTGGIIALGLGMGLTFRDIVDFYVTKAPAIFRNELRLRSLSHWFCRKYPQQPLRAALQDPNVFGQRLFGESTKPLVIPSYNLGEDDVYLFKTPHHITLRRDWKVPAWQVALATSAAPTYFAACRSVSGIRLIDGGVWANNPTMVGIAEAISVLSVPLAAIRVLSIGTLDPVVNRRKLLNWGGKLAWANSAVDIVMRGQSLGAYKQALHLLGGDRVRRLEPRVPDNLYKLDKLSTDQLIAKAAHESRIFGPTFSKEFQPHVARDYAPIYK
jgi:patatin-like phospholipase/acyl hydrolase